MKKIGIVQFSKGNEGSVAQVRIPSSASQKCSRAMAARRCSWPSPALPFLRSRSSASSSSSLGASSATVAEVFRIEHSFRQEDVDSFALVSGDSNPIHTSPSLAASHGFASCVVHGMLSASLFPALIAARFPGAYIASQTLRFKEPALVGDCLEAEAKVLSVSAATDSMKGRCLSIELHMECFKKERRTLVLEGKSKILVPQL